ncbi:MAG: diaminopimelate decarboxylase [Pseudomonadota bacterium]
MFTYQNNVFHAEHVALSDIADQYGTPCYVYSKAAFTQHFKAYTGAFGDHPHLVAYAVKANSNLAVLQVLAQLGAGFDIVSRGELERVLAAGGQPERIVFSGVAKTVEEIERALTVGIHCFNVESVAELERIDAVARRMNTVAPVSLRVNPNVDAQTHPYISTGLKENKFGIDIDLAFDVITNMQTDALRWKGVDCHIGSQLTETQPFLDAMDLVLALVDRLSAAGVALSHIDMGGGLGVCYNDEQPPAVSDYIGAMLARLGERQLSVVLEPGRSIAANAGVFLTSVEYLKRNGDKHFAIVDGAMNDLIRPSLYSAWMAIQAVTPHENGTAAQFDVVGPVCETGDFLGKDRLLNLTPGDVLAVKGAGAYGFVMASNYNSRPKVCEIMVDGDQHQVIRERETLAQLWQGEHLLKG